MDQLRAMRTYVAVCEQGGFTAAGQRLNTSKAAVSRIVSELEAHLGVRLLQRTTRRVQVTQAGEQYLVHCHAILAQVEETEAGLSAEAHIPKGRVRVSASLAWGQRFLGPFIPKFIKQWPDVQLDLTLTERYVDLVSEGIDVAIRVGGDPESSLYARKLCTTRHGLFASPDYLTERGTPRTVSDLADHACLMHSRSGPSRQWWIGGEAATPKAALRCDNGDVLAATAANGAGLVSLPDFIAADCLATGQLVCLEWEPANQTQPIMAIYPERRYLPLAVRTFIDALADEVMRNPAPD